jgi:hypothetical protein
MCQVFWIPYAFTKFGFLCAAIGGINGKDAPLIGIGTGNLFSEGRGVKRSLFSRGLALTKQTYRKRPRIGWVGYTRLGLVSSTSIKRAKVSGVLLPRWVVAAHLAL